MIHTRPSFDFTPGASGLNVRLAGQSWARDGKGCSDTLKLLSEIMAFRYFGATSCLIRDDGMFNNLDTLHAFGETICFRLEIFPEVGGLD